MATCSSVLLGVCDAPSRELHLSPYENKIGGYPDFFPSSSLPSAPRCSSCGEPLVLALQVYCPLEGSPYHRLIHIFCCSRQHCYERNNGWLALRSQLKDPSYSKDTSTLASSASAVSSLLGDSNALSEWCVGADDWGMDEEGGQERAGEEGWGEGGEGGEMEREVKWGDQEGEQMEGEHLKQRTEDGETCEISMRLSEGTKLNESQPSSGTPACSVSLASSESQCEESVDNAEADSLADQVTTMTLSSEETGSGDTSLAYQGSHFGSFYINVINEPSADEEMTEQVDKLLQKYGKENLEDWGEPRRGEYERSGKRKPSGGGSGAGGAGGRRGTDGGERYEKTVAKHGDRMFQKFHKVVSRCPSQNLRYHWRGAPLLISDKHDIPRPEEVMCRSCGAPCVFELQLMPPLVYILQKNYHSIRGYGECGVEFGTVFVYSCSRSCWKEGEGGFRQETIIVQTDPDSDMIICLVPRPFTKGLGMRLEDNIEDVSVVQALADQLSCMSHAIFRMN